MRSTCSGSPALAPSSVGENQGLKIFSQITCRGEEEEEGVINDDVKKNNNPDPDETKQTWWNERGGREEMKGWDVLSLCRWRLAFHQQTHTHTHTRLRRQWLLSVSRWLAGGGSTQVDLRRHLWSVRAANRRAACHRHVSGSHLHSSSFSPPPLLFLPLFFTSFVWRSNILLLLFEALLYFLCFFSLFSSVFPSSQFLRWL